MAAEAHERIIVFGKAPSPGNVKTRLVPLLGEQGAADLHAALLDRALDTAREYGAAEVELNATDTSNSTIQAFAARYGASLVAQSRGALGERMHSAFDRALSADRCRSVVLIGADCPVLTATHIAQAFHALRSGCQAVFAPAEDGGYVLIGLTCAASELFAGIAWSTAAVMTETRTRLRHLGWTWHELETLWDVDRPDDYARLMGAGLTPFGDNRR